MAAYGAINGLGLRGDPKVKAKLIRSVERAIERGDWGRVLELTIAYGAGSAVGSLARPTIERVSTRIDSAVSRWV